MLRVPSRVSRPTQVTLVFVAGFGAWMVSAWTSGDLDRADLSWALVLGGLAAVLVVVDAPARNGWMLLGDVGILLVVMPLWYAAVAGFLGTFTERGLGLINVMSATAAVLHALVTLVAWGLARRRRPAAPTFAA